MRSRLCGGDGGRRQVVFRFARAVKGEAFRVEAAFDAGDTGLEPGAGTRIDSALRSVEHCAPHEIVHSFALLAHAPDRSSRVRAPSPAPRHGVTWLDGAVARPHTLPPRGRSLQGPEPHQPLHSCCREAGSAKGTSLKVNEAHESQNHGGDRGDDGRWRGALPGFGPQNEERPSLVLAPLLVLMVSWLRESGQAGRRREPLRG